MNRPSDRQDMQFLFVILLVCHRLQQQSQFKHLGNKFLYIYKPATCLKFLLECNVLHIICKFNVYLLLWPTNKFILSFSTFINLNNCFICQYFSQPIFFFLFRTTTSIGLEKLRLDMWNEYRIYSFPIFKGPRVCPCECGCIREDNPFSFTA
jgi:hypothetical protein